MRIPNTIDVVHAGPGACHDSPSLNACSRPMSTAPSTAPGQVADPPEHGGRERDQAEREPVVEADGRVVEGEDDAGRACEAAGDQERERDRAVDVDAHHRGRILVLRRRPHRLALARVLHEVDQREQHRHGDEDDEQPVPGVDDAADREDLTGRQRLVDGDGLRPLPDDGDVLQDERHADGGDQRRQPWRVP